MALFSIGAEGSQEMVNPIRKVVTMLQMMQNKVAAEGEKEKELFEKYMCYCKNSGGDLAKSIAAANTKIPEVQSDIEESEAEKAQLSADVETAKADRVAAKDAMAEATALREKGAAAFASSSSDMKTNIAAMGKAIAALEKGMTGSFLQSSTAATIRQVVTESHDLINADRDEVLEFLSTSQSSQYAPQSGSITGILKQMKETMEKSLAKEEADEAAAIKAYDELMAAKTKEVNALTAAIESKLVRIGDLGVKIVEMKEDLSDTEKALIEDTKFLADLKKNCATKEAEWAQVCKTRAEELVALSETIKLLNDDDALELFKKTLPTPAASLMQVQVTSASMKARALALIEEAKKRHGSVNLDLLSMALKGKSVSFDKVLKMIDDMVALLKKEQVDDDDKKAYCLTEFDTLDDKKKALERSISDLEAAISDA
jgi:outer membrane murein-binding lipoprotein Lpp